MRVGLSSDIHRLVSGRRLMLSGVHVPFELGELAHSDGDVVFLYFIIRLDLFQI